MHAEKVRALTSGEDMNEQLDKDYSGCGASRYHDFTGNDRAF